MDLSGDPSGKAPTKSSSETTIGISSCIGNFPVDARVEDFLEKSFASDIASKGMNVIDVHEQANGIDLKAVNKAYVAFSKDVFGHLEGKGIEQNLDHAIEIRENLRNHIDFIFDNLSCDVWVLPVTPTGFAFPHNPEQGRIDILHKDGKVKPTNYWASVLSYVLPFTVTGHPVVTMPIGMVSADDVKLPLGVQVVGRRGGG